MKFQKTQQFISVFILFFLLFNITFRIPVFFPSVYAGNSDFYNIVSILVEQDVYNQIESKIERYSKDISGVLKNTKVVILPVKKNNTAFEIASLNENLYRQGYRGLIGDTDFESKLVGTVLIGDITIPEVFKNNQSAPTIIPFVDFDDKVYIYDQVSERFEYNQNSISNTAEIWHGLIRPNTGDSDQDIQGLKDYFDKNHDFYLGTGAFKYSEGVMNGNPDREVPKTYQPYVFYFDGLGESQSLNYNSFRGYEAYLENKEDIVYKRFTNDLANRIQETVLTYSQDEVATLLQKVDSKLVLEKSNPLLGNVIPDIQTRHITEKTLKKFLESFAKGGISQMRENVHNAGRYNETGSKVNIDMIPYLLTLLDVINDEVIKTANDDLEKEINSIVQAKISGDIYIPTSIVSEGGGVGKIYGNYRHGQKASEITDVSQCSIYRGNNDGGQLVEANRGYNVYKTNEDVDYLNTIKRVNGSTDYSCLQNIPSGDSLQGVWGGNTPLNFISNTIDVAELSLRYSNLDSSLVPLFDITGGKKSGNNKALASPLNCLDANFLLETETQWIQKGGKEGDLELQTVYNIPTLGSYVGWTCNSFPVSGENSMSYQNLMAQTNPGVCERMSVIVGESIVKSLEYDESCEGGEDGGCECDGGWIVNTFYFNKISSLLSHASPEAETLIQQIDNGTTPNLPVDKNRYVDFIVKDGSYAKINYPYLFRIAPTTKKNFSLEKMNILLADSLGLTSAEINQFAPKSIQLLDFIKNKPNKTVQIDGVSKNITYLDTLVFALYWNNLNSVSEKYAFLFKHYLSDSTENSGDYMLPQSKKSYEIAYLGAKGDAKNMYISLDPLAKKEQPFGAIVAQNNILRNSLYQGRNNYNPQRGDEEGVFKCAPPEGVDIFKWIPAVFCWIGNMLPPTISISDGTCGAELLSEDEREFIQSCNGDINKDGINDCLENNLPDSKIILSTDSDKYYYNSLVQLQGILFDKNNKQIRYANDTRILFNITEIIDSQTAEVLFDLDDPERNDEAILQRYVNFSSQTIKTISGESSYGFSVKRSDVIISLQGSLELMDVDNSRKVALESDIISIEVSSDRLFASAYGVKTGREPSIVSGVLASEEANIFVVDSLGINNNIQVADTLSSAKEKLVFAMTNLGEDGSSKKLDYPISVELFKDTQSVFSTKVSAAQSNDYISLGNFSQAGSYRMLMTDRRGFSIEKIFSVLPEIASDAEIILGSSVMEVGGAVSTSLITLKDRYGNPTLGRGYTLAMEIQGKGLQFYSQKNTKQLFQTLEAYKAFRLESTLVPSKNSIDIEVRDGERVLFTKTKEITTIQNPSIFLQAPVEKPTVGGGEYIYNLSLRSKEGTILTGMNSRIYIQSDTNVVRSNAAYFDVKNGEAEIILTTKQVAVQETSLSFQVEGFLGIQEKTIQVLPGIPMRLQPIVSQSKMKASQESETFLEVTLKDRYNNTVFTQNSGNIILDIPAQYSQIISPDRNNIAIKNGKTRFVLSGTDIPGKAYFRVFSDINIEGNSFEIQGSKAIKTISGIGENTGNITTYYVWNSEEIGGSNYNALYTTLLGADYGNVAVPGYLAGELLFNKNNKALAVTTLLRDGSNKNSVIQLQNNGNLTTSIGNSDISQDIEITPTIEKNKVTLNFYNAGLQTNIGKAIYVMDKTVETKNCSFRSCGLPNPETETTNIFLSSNDPAYTILSDNGNMVLQSQSGQKIITQKKNGDIIEHTSLTWKNQSNTFGELLSLGVFIGNKNIGTLELQMSDARINISRDFGVFTNKTQTLKNSILVYLETNQYGSNISENKLDIIYKDPFASNKKADSFSQDFPGGYEFYSGNNGTGWKGGNKTLLGFSAGESVGEASQRYQSFGSINLGDPVVSMKKRKRNIPNQSGKRKFDRTTGKQLTTGADIFGYKVFDYDKDQRDDILIIKNNNQLQLLENKSLENNILDKGNIATIADLGSKDLIQVGDFSGDGYEDIFFVNTQGIPFLLDNKQKDFVRVNLESILNLSGRIVRSEVFDMDTDGLDDIISLDDSGAIHIFYGKPYWDIPEFSKKLVTDKYGIILENKNRKSNAIIYFDELSQITLDDRNDKNLGVKNAINNLIYTPISYPVFQDALPKLPQQEPIEGVPGLAASQATIDRFVKENGNAISYSSQFKTTEEKLFLQSYYSDTLGLDFQRTMNDLNGDTLQAGDTIDVEIKLTNTSNAPMKNIIFGEKVLDILSFNGNDIITSQVAVISEGLAGYSFMVDSFSLLPQQSMTIRYTGTTKALSYGYLQVGLFETGELGDDGYGDILLKKDNQNCSSALEIFRSQGIRSYQKGTTTAVCDTNSALPEILQKNNTDTDENGVPDYIDNLLRGEPADMQKYAQEQKALLYKDTDGDGIPDNEDAINASGDIYKIIGSDSFSQNADTALEGLNNIFEGLSCGFGGGACYSSPLNWAPLAPGSDPTFMGKLIGDGLKIDEGNPVFSSLTGWQTTCGTSPCCLPSVYPVHTAAYIPGPSCGSSGAGGRLGVSSPTNTVRIFVTPTITGAVGTAVCYGGPAAIAGQSVPKGWAPLVPGGNCIVAAKPIVGCNNDGSEGNIASLGFSEVTGSYGIINGNCKNSSSDYVSLRPELSKNFVKDYLQGLANSSSLAEDFQGAMVDHSTQNNSDFQIGSEGGLIDGQFDISSEGNPSDFEDVIQVQNKRPSAFPNFMMDWVTRQTEEFVNKLTDLPTIFIILPDFTGVIDTKPWAKNSDDVSLFDGNNILADSYTGENKTLGNLASSTKGVRQSILSGGKKAKSSIDEVYEFMANTPLITIHEEPVYVNIPWIDLNDLDKTLGEYKQKGEEYKQEIKRASESWTAGTTCDNSTAEGQKKCEEENAAINKAKLNSQATLRSLEKNIEVIESYKKLPQQIGDLINTKEKYLEQIMCNVEAIESMTGGWIERNGQRFKAWVDTYILIKSLLKSWQVMIDVFIDYDAECRECKNERQDSIGGQFDIIGSLNINIPIIILPKWPDIELDLHNIRANIDVPLPSFRFNTRPVIFPTLPDLRLPDVPSISLTTPIFPVLPTIELPELPDLPSLPSVELPDLPPPPKIPKIFANIEVVVDILKLVTKAMCILKSSPFVPEWRAGDQIAFITERNGYQSSDFLDLQGPQFSLPWIDKIKVASFVNLEFEADFITQMARASVEPLNSFSNNSHRLFEIQSQDLDIVDMAPGNIDINIDDQGDIESEIGQSDISTLAIASYKALFGFMGYLDTNKEKELTTKEFYNELSTSLASNTLAGDAKFDGLQNIWHNAQTYTFSAENKKIKELQKQNIAKYEALKSIIGTEIEKTKRFAEDWKNESDSPYFIQVSHEDTASDIDAYNKQLQPYQDAFVQAAKNLIAPEAPLQINAIKEEGNNILTKLETTKNNYLADNHTTTALENGPSCDATKKQANTYNYKGIYVLESGQSYRLFDYMDELDGNELTQIIDIDSDGDEDLLYLSSGQLFLKENMNQNRANIIASQAILVEWAENKFLNGDVYIEAVNNLEDLGVQSQGVNLGFLSSTDTKVSQYRLEFFPLIDAFLNKDNSGYYPRDTKKSIFDMFFDLEKKTLQIEEENYKTYKNLGYIKRLGNFKDITISTTELKNIQQDLRNNNAVSLGALSHLYAGNTDFVIDYQGGNNTDIISLRVEKQSHVIFDEKIRIVGISGSAYISTGNQIELAGGEILTQVGKPLFAGFKLQNNADIPSQDAYVELEYFDGTMTNIHFSKVSEFRIFDFGSREKRQFVSFDLKNDFYYGKIQAFGENIFGTYSNHVNFSPQNSGDMQAPTLSLKDIKVPIYQKVVFDLTSFIYEISGMQNIKIPFIDMDINIDSDGDGNSKNDRDVGAENISIDGNRIRVTFLPEEAPVKKIIGVELQDLNNNLSYTEINFEVYTPIPNITSYSDGTIVGSLNEPLDKEPINLYRYRGGGLRALKSASGAIKSLTNKGTYGVDISAGEKGLSLEYNGLSIAQVNEQSGKITGVNPAYNIEVLASNAAGNNTGYPRISIVKDQDEIFYQNIQLTANKNIFFPTDLPNMETPGLYIDFMNKTDYNYYKIPAGAPINPGALIIYRSNNVEKQALFIIFPDGRIKTWNQNYRIFYKDEGENIILQLHDGVYNRSISELEFVLKGEYILQ